MPRVSAMPPPMTRGRLSDARDLRSCDALSAADDALAPDRFICSFFLAVQDSADSATITFTWLVPISMPTENDRPIAIDYVFVEENLASVTLHTIFCAKRKQKVENSALCITIFIHCIIFLLINNKMPAWISNVRTFGASLHKHACDFRYNLYFEGLANAFFCLFHPFGILIILMIMPLEMHQAMHEKEFDVIVE